MALEMEASQGCKDMFYANSFSLAELQTEEGVMDKLRESGLI